MYSKSTGPDKPISTITVTARPSGVQCHNDERDSTLNRCGLAIEQTVTHVTNAEIAKAAWHCVDMACVHA